jgi:CheY-like chemotaxis protein/HPt (histidine-containing phosphotransfer) domain-containing protein
MKDTVAEDGWQAMEILHDAARQGTPFKVGIIDLNATDEAGVELARTINRDPLFRDMPLIVLTSSFDAENEKSENAAANVIFLIKPWRKSQLFNCLIALVGAHAKTAPEPQPVIATAEASYDGDILLAEDNLVNQEVARAFLNKLGCRVELVSNGKRALEALAQKPFDLVFMDCQMPEMDGYEAARAIRGQEVTVAAQRRLPIIAMTAHALDGDREKCLAAGMDDYLGKPFSVEQITAILEKWLPQQKEAAGRAPITPEGSPSTSPTRHSLDSPARTPLDHKILDGIRALQPSGAPDLLGKVITAYLSETPKLLDRLFAALNQADADTARRAAHSLKSSSAHVGAVKLSALFKELEAMAKIHTLDNSAAMVAEVSQEFRLVQQALRAELQGTEA